MSRGRTFNEEAPPGAYRPGRSPLRARSQEALHERVVPVSAHIPAYGPSAGRRDLLAGLTVAALAIPSAMAYAEVAGVPPVNGPYALLLPAVLYTFLGSSRQLIVGPEGSISALVGAALLPLAVAGTAEAAELAATLALLVAAASCSRGSHGSAGSRTRSWARRAGRPSSSASSRSARFASRASSARASPPR